VFHSPYDIFVDPTRALYRALGMTRSTSDAGAEEDYVVHGPIGGSGMMSKNPLKMPLGMPAISSSLEENSCFNLGGLFLPI
jgi:hypothetical protein